MSKRAYAVASLEGSDLLTISDYERQVINRLVTVVYYKNYLALLSDLERSMIASGKVLGSLVLPAIYKVHGDLIGFASKHG